MKNQLGRRQRKKLEVRNRIYNAALHLFKTQGYESTTVQQICELADTARGTFFNYYPTKEHVLAAYHDEMTGQILASIAALYADKVEWLILNATQVFADRAQSDPAMARIILRIMFGSDVLINADQTNEKKLIGWFRKQIKYGIHSGELRPDLNVELFCSLLLGTLSTTLQGWLLADRKFNLTTAFKEKVGFLFRAARVDRSQKLEKTIWNKKR